jgi:hypothetical protein
MIKVNTPPGWSYTMRSTAFKIIVKKFKKKKENSKVIEFPY